MKYFFLKFKYLLVIILTFYIGCFISQNKEQNNVGLKKEENKIKKVRKIDIATLRENLANECIIILQLVEKVMNMLLKDINAKLFTKNFQEVLNVFGWVNQCIIKFHDDASSFDREQIELYLNQAQKYKLFLNSI